ncbi:hypothetical protein [Rhizobium sp. BR 249]|uniref:hypothetical protein n=1 Tax=Rhizobium sp. BR 249 TaxID=3040011 RepID=UPI0039BFDE8A
MSLPTKIVVHSFSRRAGQQIEVVPDIVKKSDLTIVPRSAIQWLAMMTGKSLLIEENDYVLQDRHGMETFRGNRSDAIREMYEFAPHFISVQEYAASARRDFDPEDEQCELGLSYLDASRGYRP